MNNTQALSTAIDAAGGQSALARALGKKQGHVWDWLNKGGQAPAEFCPSIEALTGVRCEDLRSDLTWTRNEGGEVTGYHVRLAAVG